MRKYVKFMIILFLILFLIIVLDITRKFIILNNCTKKISETNYRLLTKYIKNIVSSLFLFVFC